MDSKYSVIENGLSSSSAQTNGFSIKRKLTNGLGQVKKIKTNGVSKDGIGGSCSQGRLPGGSSNTNGSFAQEEISIQAQRKNLPVYHVKESLMKKIMKHQTLIIIGETGSGKTTQIPQYIFEYGAANEGVIAVTQPRRVAAITISGRVAREQNCNLGTVVGYTVRFEDLTSSDTKIKFITDGSLLREALSDRLLTRYQVIILDEAHERTINTDVLFGIVKEAQRQRAEQKMAPLKIIIMSATMDVDHFKSYFNSCEAIYLSGRTYPIKVFHTKEPQNDYQQACLSTLFDIHQNAPPNHDVLMFLTGQDEIETLAAQIRTIVKSKEIDGPSLRVYPLYSQLPQSKQLDAFQPISPDSRKLVLCTNIAETSLTIKGIKYVIDSGVVKRRMYDCVTGIDVLKVVPISKDQAWQRTGRAGRESEGSCYRTYSMADYKALDKTTMPEILRANISATVLQLMALEINIQKFDFLDKPSDSDIKMALKQLHMLEAIKSEDSTELTLMGQKMSKFPLDPRFSKMLLVASKLGCLEEILSIVALLSGENIFVHCFDVEKRAQANVAHSRFESQYGDHLTLLNVFNAYQKLEKPKTWCHEHFLNLRNLTYAKNVRMQLKQICNTLNLPSNEKDKSIDADQDLIRKCLITGLFNNIAEMKIDNYQQFVTLSNRQKVKIHPSSVLLNKRPKFVLYTELVSTSHNYMRCISSIEPEWIEEMVPHFSYFKRFTS